MSWVDAPLVEQNTLSRFHTSARLSHTREEFVKMVSEFEDRSTTTPNDSFLSTNTQTWPPLRAFNASARRRQVGLKCEYAISSSADKSSNSYRRGPLQGTIQRCDASQHTHMRIGEEAY